jgi:hypothetical protein
MTRVLSRSSEVSRGRCWIRAWGRDEPVPDDPAAGAGDDPLPGGPDIPAVPDGGFPWARSRGCRLETVSITPGAGRVGLLTSHRSLLGADALPVVPQSIEQGPGHRAVPVGDGRPFSRSPSFVLQPKGRAFRRLRTKFNDVWAALVDEPTSQLHGCATKLLKLLGPE